MWKKILLGLAAVLAIILIAAAFRPDSYVVEHSAVINAPADVVFAHLTDHRDWQKSNPWVKDDPTAKASYSGPATGVGATYSWTGDAVGKGSATIKEARPSEYVSADLHFLEPFESVAMDEYLLTSNGTSTKVVHRMSGENGYISKLMGMFFGFEGMMHEKFALEFSLMNEALKGRTSAATAP